MHTPRISSLWALLFLTSCILLVGGSLYPFHLRAEPAPNGMAFLWAAWPVNLTRTDILTNIAIYVPFGLFGMRWREDNHGPALRFLVVCVTAACFSVAMETLQLFIRYRVASNADIAFNLAGVAAGIALSPLLSGRSRLAARLIASKRYYFRSGWITRAGLILVALWLLTQFSLQAPSLLAGGLQTGFKPFWEAGRHVAFDGANTLLFALEVASISLFTAVLLRPERCTIRTVALIAAGALLLKFAAAAFLVKLPVMPRLLSWEALLGLGFGLALSIIPMLRRDRLPQPPFIAGLLGAFALAKLIQGLPFITATGATPDLAHQPEVLFNISGIAYVVAEIWPYLALGCTVALLDRES